MIRREPIFNAPGVIVALAAVYVGVHLLRSLLSPEQDLWWTAALAFIPARYTGLVSDIPGGQAAAVTSFVTHTFLHGDTLHLMVNCAWLLALGAPVARRIGTVRFLILYFASGMVGALLYLATNFGQIGIVVGASGAISGLMGAAFRFIFRAMDWSGGRGMGSAASWVPRMSLREMARDRRIVWAIGAWIVINLVFALAAQGMLVLGGIAWEAHLGGFLFGLLTFALFDTVEPAPSDASPDDHVA